MTGFVSLVGAGPGNLEMLTLLAKRRLAEADIVLYDRLVNPALITPITAEKIDVGKLPHHHKYSQYKINELLVKLAQDGKRVVRLKAGDPYVFGRGGEEGQYLKANNVNFEVVSGLTSAIAGLAAAGIPMTHRDFASSFHVITGHRKQDGKELDWPNIANQEGTLVFLMGMEQLATICHELIANGKDAATPVAVVQWATHYKQRSVSGNLKTIAEIVTQAQITSPALIVVGEVVSLMPELQPQLPLQGAHVLLAYDPKHQRVPNVLQDNGASIDFFKKAARKPLEFTMPDWQVKRTLLVTDYYSMMVLRDTLVANKLDLRQLAGWQIAPADMKVAKRIRHLGVFYDKLFNADELAPDEEVLAIGRDELLQPYADNDAIRTLAVYEKQPVTTDVDLADFQAVVLTNGEAAIDFKAAFTMNPALKCLATDKLVADKCLALEIPNVVKVSKRESQLVKALAEVIK